MNEELKRIVKQKCNITWEDKETNQRIEEIIEDAIIIVKDKIGAKEIDFSIPGKERNLFKNYCFYEWNNKVSEFDNNYENEILQLRQKYEVKQYDEEKQELQ